MAARPRAGAPVRVCASPRASARVSPGLSGSLGAAGPARPALPACRPARRVGRSPRTCRVLARTLVFLTLKTLVFSNASPSCVSLSAFLSG